MSRVRTRQLFFLARSVPFWLRTFFSGLLFLGGGWLFATIADTTPVPSPETVQEKTSETDPSGLLPVRFSLDWRWEGGVAPLAVAVEKGYFEKEGLAVTFETAAGSKEPVERLIAKTHDMAFGDINTLIRAYGQRQKPEAKAVLMVHDIPSFALIGRKSRGITEDIQSLEGKKIGAPGGDASYSLFPILKSLEPFNDESVQFINVGFGVRDLMLAQGELDAVFGFAISTVINIVARGIPADDIVVLKYHDRGIQLYGNAIIVSDLFAQEHPEAVRGFLRAYVKGLKDVIADPDEGAAALAKLNEAADIAVENERIQLLLKENILTHWVLENGFGNIDPKRMAKALEQLEIIEPFKESVSLEQFFTDQFLPPLEERKFSANGPETTPLPVTPTPTP